MSNRPFASIMALYQYDPTIFDDMHLPEALDEELLTDNIMLELGELGLLYADPDLMKFYIERWSRKNLEKWTKLYETTQYEYDPIENYNRTETGTVTDTETHNTIELETRDLNGSNNEVRDLDGSVTNSGTDNVAKTVNAYNEGVGVESERDTTTHGMVQASEDNGSIDRTLTDQGTVEDKKTGTVTNANVTSLNMKGNIGVTTTQQMIEQERGILEFNIYDYIVDDFKDQFCVRVW